MRKRFLVTSSPHYRAEWTTRSIMLDVIIALLPIIGVSVIFFGWRALTVTAVSVAGCIATELIFNLISGKKTTITDLSCVVTGILLALSLPVAVPYWLVIVGDVFAIAVVKMLFGGIGKNFVNPALGARAFLFSWPSLMMTFVSPMLTAQLPVFSDPIFVNGGSSEIIDAVSSATPLSQLGNGTLSTSLFDLFIGNHAGCIGETSTAAILIGAAYLLCRRVITLHIPLAYIGTVALITFVFPLTGDAFNVNYMLTQLCSGGLMLAAFFMATDYVTSPMTWKGKIVYGIGCGLLTVIMRYFSSYPEGVTYSILIMNVFAFTFDKIFKPKRYGTGGNDNA